MDFDVVPYEDITWGHRLGAGSFGSVYKGSYLGIDIAIKEVLPSTEYDVHKYFEREWRIMRECRHPNIVLFLGLSRAPEGDGRVFIISEFVPRGNLRQYILSSRPFPWRLRLSFATDVARAVAYLHARSCIHRDLKGENLLLTSNDRVKVTDFGFARIASRNAEEMNRMTYCGTDGYMSPEIINGFEFDLPTDVFSLGIILVEILSRRLVDSKTFVRQAPAFVPEEAEIRRRASPGCPPALIDLAIHCCKENPGDRPLMHDVLTRLREIEREVLSRLDDEAKEHVGSIKVLQHTGKRAMPIFQPADKDANQLRDELAQGMGTHEEGTETEGEEDVKQMEVDALHALAGLKIDGQGPAGSEITLADGKQTWRTARWDERPSVISQFMDASEIQGHRRLLPTNDTTSSFEAGSASGYTSAHIQRPLDTASAAKDATPPDEAASTMTVRASHSDSDSVPVSAAEAVAPADIDATPKLATRAELAPGPGIKRDASRSPSPIPRIQTKAERADEEANKSAPPIAQGTHRFTLVDKETLQLISGKKPSNFPAPFAAFLPKALAPTHKCPVCHKRIGQRPALQCDDCAVIVHVKCSHAAARNCTGGDGAGGEPSA